ncbi:hypothetical protein GE21DRAFT_1304492 [Neurospora crassa]|nr:hypothetical protein GE21DRAFT_1304492 [Neurospora crassa]
MEMRKGVGEKEEINRCPLPIGARKCLRLRSRKLICKSRGICLHVIGNGWPLLMGRR